MYRLMLKERKYLKENIDLSDKSEFFTVEMNPEDFIKLTPYEETIKSRAEKITTTGYSPIKASAEGGFNLLLDPDTGKILAHQGRARAYAASKSGVNLIPVTIKIHHSKTGASRFVSWNELPDSFVQQEGSNTVAKNKFKPIELEEPRIYRAALKQADGSLKMLGGLFKLSTFKEDPRVLKGEKVVLTRTPDELLGRSYNAEDFEKVEV